MRVLVTGGTGSIGTYLVKELVERSVTVRILSRKQPDKGKVPDGVEIAIGDLLDPVSLEKALDGVDKLFLLSAVAAEELTQTLVAYGVARRLNIKHITYLSVFRVEQFLDVPHFASKAAAEAALRQFGVPFSILRPGYFIQNDGMFLKEELLNKATYSMPIGDLGLCMVDVRDIARAAATTLTEEGHAGKTYDLVGPSLISGPAAAAIWSEALGKHVEYTGEDFDRWEVETRKSMPGWWAFDMRSMLQGFVDRGLVSTPAQVKELTKLLGRSPLSYEDYVKETVRQWNV